MQCSCVNVARDWEKRQNAFFSLFLKGMLSQAILQMADSKRAQVDLARIILRLPKNLDNTLYQTWLHSEETFWPARGRCIASRRIPAVGGTRTNAATTDNGNCSPPPLDIFINLFIRQNHSLWRVKSCQD